MSDQWFVAAAGGAQRGPFSFESLRELAARGRLPATTLIWRQGMPQWLPAGSVPGLFPGAPPAPHPAATPPHPKAAPKRAASMMIKGRCSRDHTFFAMRFVQQPAGDWELQQGYPLSAESGQKKGHGERSIDGEISVGAGYAGCPSCQDRALFFCPTCQTINCQGSGFIQGGNLIVHCAACGSPGCVQGDVKSLDGFVDL
jgi:hypothetical protein